MKRIYLILLLLLGLALPAVVEAQSCAGLTLAGIRPVPTGDGGHQELAVSSTAVALTVPTVFTVRYALVTVKTNAVSTLDTGANPSATVGQFWNPSEKFFVCQSSLVTFRAIRQSADAVLAITYYGN